MSLSREEALQEQTQNPADLVVDIDKPLQHGSAVDQYHPLEDAQNQNQLRRAWEWTKTYVDPTAYLVNGLATVTVNVALPMIPYVGDAMREFERVAQPAYDGVTTTLNGANTRLLQARLHPEGESTVHWLVKGGAHLVASFATGNLARFALPVLFGAVTTPAGAAVTAAAQAVVAPVAGRLLEKGCELGERGFFACRDHVRRYLQNRQQQQAVNHSEEEKAELLNNASSPAVYGSVL